MLRCWDRDGVLSGGFLSSLSDPKAAFDVLAATSATQVETLGVLSSTRPIVARCF